MYLDTITVTYDQIDSTFTMAHQSMLPTEDTHSVVVEIHYPLWAKLHERFMGLHRYPFFQYPDHNCCHHVIKGEALFDDLIRELQ